MRGLAAALPVRTLQAGRVVTGCGPRHATVPITVTIPPVDGDDIELVLSNVAPPEGESYSFDRILPVGDKVLLLDSNGGDGVFAVRHGDAFTFAINEDDWLNTRGVLRNAHLGHYTEFGNSSHVPRWILNTQFTKLSDDTIVHHRSIGPNVAAVQVGSGRDEFMALDVDVDGETGTWGTEHHPLQDAGAQLNLGYDGVFFGESPLAMCRLDDTHVAVIGRYPQTAGRQPFVSIVEQTGDRFASYGPWDIGAKSAEGGFYPGEEAFLVPLTGNRFLALWMDYHEPDVTGVSYTFHRRILHAQVVSYDLSGHTATVGALCRMHAGIEGGDTQLIHFSTQDLLFLFCMNWSQIDDLDPSAVGYVGGEEHIAGRSLIIQGTDVLAGAVVPIAYANHDRTSWDNYWYGFQMVTAGDRAAIIWTDIGDDGGDIKYTKVRLGIAGAERGALGVYDEGTLIPNPSGTDKEIWSQGGNPVQLPSGEGLAVFVHYTADYDLEVYRVLLAKEQA